jgi:hypothetical protein
LIATECDSLIEPHLVFISRFFKYFDWSTWEMFESVLGAPRQDLVTTYDIIGVPLVYAQVRFHVRSSSATMSRSPPGSASSAA